MQKVVHFDLKGAPPKLSYFEQVLHGIKSWGATGVLLEWEDTFPYSGNLKHLGSESNCGGDEMYNIVEVQCIFAICKELGLEVIQLVQTIGHMEFVLKHACHRHLREYDRSPASICPDKRESVELVQQMVMQVLALQPDAKYFHIGADEVSHIGYCDNCYNKVKSKSPLDYWRIYLDYILDLVLFIKDQRPNITILMWDDMIRVMCSEALEEFCELTEMVQLVVWNYDMRENFRFPPGMWHLYNRFFPRVWAGSAFKGANGSCQLISPVARYIRNQEAWINEIRGASTLVKFVGVVLTGWSRYDHFATLCELLPTSLNSLANCIKCFDARTLENFAILHNDNTLPDEQWPGKALAECAIKLTTVYQEYGRLACGDLKTTWFNTWQLDNGFLNMFQLDNIENYVFRLMTELKALEEIVTRELSAICGPRACAEFLRTHIGAMEMGFLGLQRTIKYARRYDPSAVEYVYGGAPASPEHGPSMHEEVLPKNDHLPPIFEYVPSTVEEVPSTAEDLPSKLLHAASMVEDVPSTDEDQPSSDEQASVTLDDAPATVEHAPSTSDPAPSTSDHAPSTGEHALSTGEHAPSTSENAPSTREHAASMAEDVTSEDKLP